MKRFWALTSIIGAVSLGLAIPTIGEGNVYTARSQVVEAFSLQEQINGDYIGFAVGAGNLPSTIPTFNKGFLHLYKTVYIGNATYMGYYRA